MSKCQGHCEGIAEVDQLMSKPSSGPPISDTGARPCSCAYTITVQVWTSPPPLPLWRRPRFMYRNLTTAKESGQAGTEVSKVWRGSRAWPGPVHRCEARSYEAKQLLLPEEPHRDHWDNQHILGFSDTNKLCCNRDSWLWGRDVRVPDLAFD